MDSEKLLKEINEYVNNDRINYAILIDGEWGTGKTYFIQEQLIPLLNRISDKKKADTKEAKKAIYISLYGVENIDDVSTELYLKATGKFSKITSIGVGLFKTLKPDINYSKALEIIKNNFKIDNYVLIFDDLERANMDVNVCLAYINTFVEHQKMKVIIVANEREIGKINYNKNYELKIISAMNKNINYNDPEKKDILGNRINGPIPNIDDVKERINRMYEVNYNYKLIKEKLIGKTYHYKPNFSNIINNLIELYKFDQDYSEFLVNNKDILLSEMNIYNCNNLRTIKCIFEDFYELYNRIKDINIKMKDTLIKKIYINFIITVINLKNGENNLQWNGEKFQEAASFGKDEHLIYSKYFLAFRFVDDYILKKEINIDEIVSVLNEYINNNQSEFENGENSYAKLKSYWELEDSEIIKLLNGLNKELESDFYPCKMFPKIILTLTYLQNLNFQIDLIEKNYNIMEKKIKTDLSEDYYIHYDQIIRDKEILEMYNDNIRRIKQASNDKKNKMNNNTLEDIFESTEWGVELYTYIHQHENYNYFFNRNAFLSLLNTEKILNLINNSNSKNIYYFKYCIDRMYSYQSLKEYYEKDKESIIYLIDGITKLDKKEYGVTKKEALDYLVNVLTEKLKLLS